MGTGWIAVCGGVLLGLSLCMILAPRQFLQALKGFPRYRVAGWILSAVVVVWCCVLLLQMHLGFLETYKPWVYVLGPAAFLFMACCMEELLAPRALGGLLLLLPTPLLQVMRSHDSAWRYTILVMAYLMVIAGMAWVMSPYLFRIWTQGLYTRPRLCRGLGILGMAGGLFLLVLWQGVFKSAQV